MPLSVRLHWVLVVLAALVVAAPIWTFRQPPILDHSGHLARLELLSSPPLDPLLARHWSVDFRLIPNLGMDLFVPAVAPLIGADAGLRLSAGLGLFLWIAGAGLLHRGFWGRYDAQTLLAAFFAFDTGFDRGFYNVHVGAGAALAATGLWAMRRRRSPVFLAAMAAFAVALPICHLTAFALFALFVVAVDAGRVATGEIEPGARRRTMVEIAVVLLPAAMVKLVWMAPGDGGPLEFDLLRNLYAVLLVIGRPAAGRALPGELVPVAEGRYGLLFRIAPTADRHCPARPRP